jgi:purine-binding chemotaxis protein CheW
MSPSEDKLKSERILDELKRRQRTKEVVDVEEERVKVVIFVCGAKLYAFMAGHQGNTPCVYILGSLSSRLSSGSHQCSGDIESVIDIRHFGEEKDDDCKY